jgi:hypothetical protein
VPPALLEELRAEADRLNDDESAHDPTAYYQGTHIGVSFEKNPVMEKLANLPQARQAVEAIAGLGRIVALHYRSSTLYRFTNILGACISEAIMRPNPRRSAWATSTTAEG